MASGSVAVLEPSCDCGAASLSSGTGVLACDASGFVSSMLGSAARMCRKLFLESGSEGGASMAAAAGAGAGAVALSQSQSPAVVRGFERGKDESSRVAGPWTQDAAAPALAQLSITRV